jgi:hypothetical protein
MDSAARGNAERLASGVDGALAIWSHDPRRAAHDLDRLLRAAPPDALVALERSYRGRRRSLGQVAVEGPFAAAIAALCTLDWSGYVREAGVRFLAASGDFLPLLLLRLNDPVEPVRALAADAVGGRLASADPAVLVQLLPIVEGLGRRRRSGGVSTTVRRILLATEAGRAAVWAGIRTGNAAVRAAGLRLLATVEPEAAVEHALATGDPTLRLWAAGVATATSLDADVQRRLLRRLERDPHPRIRWRAVRAWSRHPDSAPHLRQALLDSDARVRYLARVALRRQGFAAGLYRATVADERAGSDALVGALAGLGDVGGGDDAALLLPFLSHRNARVRGEAWRSLAALDPAAFAARVDQLRADSSGKVRRYLTSTPSDGTGSSARRAPA